MPRLSKRASPRIPYRLGAEPVFRPDLGDTPLIAYYRKSSRHESMQVYSVEQQRERVEAHFTDQANGGRRVLFWWSDDHTGTTFNRPAWQSLRAFCVANPQPLDRPGTVGMWEMDRFSRLLNKVTNKADLGGILDEWRFFQRLGWRLDFVQTPMGEDELLNLITGLIKLQQAAQYSATLRVNTQRGKRHIVTETGRWVAGIAPYPARRVTADKNRPLGPGERAGGSGTLLERDPNLYPTWELAARECLKGSRFGSIARLLRDTNAPLGDTMVEWTSQTVKRMLTNRALISAPTWHLSGGDLTVDAAWEPIVDRELFDAVQIEVDSREYARPTRSESTKLLDLYCPACNAAYTCAVRPDGRRMYSHPSPMHSMKSAEWRERAQAAGCRVYVVDAEEAERQVYEVLCEERAGGDWLAALWREQGWAGTSTAEAEARDETLEAHYQQINAEYEQLRANLRHMRNPELIAEFEQELSVLKAKRDKADRDRQHAQRQRQVATAQFKAMEERVRFANDVLSRWATAALDDKRAVIEYWVDIILVRPVPLSTVTARKRNPKTYKGKKTSKELLIFLHSAPDQPKVGELAMRYGDGNELSYNELLDAAAIPTNVPEMQ